MLEPALGLFDAMTVKGLYESTYATLSKTVPLNLVTFYDDVGESFEWVSKLPVAAVSMDFCGVVRRLSFGSGALSLRGTWKRSDNSATLLLITFSADLIVCTARKCREQ